MFAAKFSHLALESTLYLELPVTSDKPADPGVTQTAHASALHLICRGWVQPVNSNVWQTVSAWNLRPVWSFIKRHPCRAASPGRCGVISAAQQKISGFHWLSHTINHQHSSKVYGRIVKNWDLEETFGLLNQIDSQLQWRLLLSFFYYAQ